MKTPLLPDFLNTQDGQCLTIYLPRLNEGDTTSNQAYLYKVRAEVSELLRWTYEPSKREEMNRRISKAILDPGVSQNHDHHMAVFIGEDQVWEFPFTGTCRPFFSLASSFHIKPLIRYFHRNRKFFLVNFEAHQVSLYVDAPTQLKLLCGVLYPKELKKELSALAGASQERQRELREGFEDFVQWVSDWVSQELSVQEAPLLVGGWEPLAESFANISTYKETLRSKEAILTSVEIEDLFVEARGTIKRLAEEEESRAIKSFLRRKESLGSSTDLSIISQQALRDNVSLLLVARDEHIWGELDRDSGDLRIHYEQSTDQDDDLLDDLSEIALKNRARVLVLERDRMPGYQSIAAIFKSRMTPLSISQVFGQRPKDEVLPENVVAL